MAREQTGREQLKCDACGSLFHSTDEFDEHVRICAGRGARRPGQRGRSSGRDGAERRGE